ncbi:hypothetical protein BHM03_00008441 [Ensete ventricosum]|nr:hypothetical protein BHM03_00008441 [Ensete ventricosum]
MWSRAGVATEEGAVASAAAAMEGIMRAIFLVVGKREQDAIRVDGNSGDIWGTRCGWDQRQASKCGWCIVVGGTTMVAMNRRVATRMVAGL